MEYAQIASYISPTQTVSKEGGAVQQSLLPSYLRPVYRVPQPWGPAGGKGGPMEDFIMIAEFSELEGPKPLMTIPKDGGADFDQNTFSLKILAVDHQHSTSDGFTISEDAQVVVADSEADVFAFVHHMVLYDNTARGFVRPYCIAYITHDQRKLMHFYEDLSWKFKKVARYFKYGNKMVFAGDLERHLKDLEYTKNYLLNQACKMRLRSTEGQEDLTPDSRKNAENELYNGLQTIQQSSLEIREILSVLKPLLPDRRLEAQFRLIEDRVYQSSHLSGQDKWSLPESGFNDFSAWGDPDIRYGSLGEPRISPLALFKPREYRPVLVETKKAKRFNVPLRGLHELCSWGAKEGLRKLRYIQSYFKRDLTVLELEKNESKLFRPKCSGIYHSQCITGNFLAGIQLKKAVNATEEAEQGWSTLYSHQWSSVGSLNSQDSFKSVDSFSTNTGILEASPSSFHTYDSQSGNIFHSASASPEKEFSFLTSHEYYPGLEAMVETEPGGTTARVSANLEMEGITSRVSANQEMEGTTARVSANQEMEGTTARVSASQEMEDMGTTARVSSGYLQNDEKAVVMNNMVAAETSVVKGRSEEYSGSASRSQGNTWKDEIGDFERVDKNVSLFDSQKFVESSVIQQSSNLEHDELPQSSECADTSQAAQYGRQSQSGELVDVSQSGELAGQFLASDMHNEQTQSNVSSTKEMLTDKQNKNHQIQKSTFNSGRDVFNQHERSISNSAMDISNQFEKSTFNSGGDVLNQHETSIFNSGKDVSNEFEKLTFNSGGDVLNQHETSISNSGKDVSNEFEKSTFNSGGDVLNQYERSIFKSGNEVLKNVYDNYRVKDGVSKEAVSSNLVDESTRKRILSLEEAGLGWQEAVRNEDLNLQLASHLDVADDGGYLDTSTDEGTLVCFTDDAAQSFSAGSFCSSGTLNETDINRNRLNMESTLGNFKLVPNIDGKLTTSASCDGCLEFLGHCGDKDDGTACHVSRRNSKLSAMLEQENDQSGGRILPMFSEISRSEPNIHHAATRSSHELMRNISLTEKLSDNLRTRLNYHHAAGNTINTTSYLSKSNFAKFSHHITRVQQLKNQTCLHPGTNDDELSVRARSESDNSSAFTEISLRDIYPHLTDVSAMGGDVLEAQEVVDTADEFLDIPSSQNPVVWKPRCGMYTVGDWISSLASGRPGYGLCEALSTYQYMGHVIFSLLSGRPVLVAGPAKLEPEVTKLINALAVFVPETRRKRHTVLEWTTKPLKITDLAKLKMVGLCRPERRSLDAYIPSAIKKASTIVDLERRIIIAPAYQGQFITSLMLKRKAFKSDAVLLSYIEWWLMDILAKAFIFFHTFCLGSSGSVLNLHHPKVQIDAYRAAVSSVMSKLGIKDSDCEIIEYMSEMVKLSELEAHIWQDVDAVCMVSPISLQHKVCETFKC